MESTESMDVDVGDRINTRVIDLARGEELFALHDIMACDVYINFLRSWFQEVIRFLAVTLQFSVSVVGNALQQIGTVRVSKNTHTPRTCRVLTRTSLAYLRSRTRRST